MSGVASLAATILMTAAISKRDVLLPAHGLGGCVLVLLLGGAAIAARAQTASVPSPPAQTRGISAHAASEAAAEQLRPVQDAPAAVTEAATPATSVPAATAPVVEPATAPVAKPAPSVLQALRDRGVLFKVTPPPSVPLPAEPVSSDASGNPVAVAAPAVAVAPVRASYCLLYTSRCV